MGKTIGEMMEEMRIRAGAMGNIYGYIRVSTREQNEDR